MSFNFRPRLENLDPRDLPSLTPFTFTLPDGTIGTGAFDYADAAVDPGQASQLVPLSGLTMVVDGQSVDLLSALTAPVAVFSQGLLQGVSFSGGLGGAFAAAPSVPGSTGITLNPLADIPNTGSLISIPALPGQPLDPNTVGPIDWAAAIATHNSNILLLNAMEDRLKDEMALYDGLTALVKDLRVKALVAPTPADTVAFNRLADAYAAKLVTHAGIIFNYSAEYTQFYEQTQQNADWLRDRLTPAQQAQMLPIPELFVVPSEYFDPLENMV